MANHFIRGGFTPYSYTPSDSLSGLGAVDPYANVAQDSTGEVTIPLSLLNSPNPVSNQTPLNFNINPLYVLAGLAFVTIFLVPKR